MTINRVMVILSMVLFGVSIGGVLFYIQKQRSARLEDTWQEEREGANEGHHELVV